MEQQFRFRRRPGSIFSSSIGSDVVVADAVVVHGVNVDDVVIVSDAVVVANCVNVADVVIHGFIVFNVIVNGV